MPISDEFDAAIADLNARLDQDSLEQAAAGAGELTPEARMALLLDVGARVRDTVTGAQGYVVRGTVRHILIHRS